MIWIVFGEDSNIDSSAKLQKKKSLGGMRNLWQNSKSFIACYKSSVQDNMIVSSGRNRPALPPLRG